MDISVALDTAMFGFTEVRVGVAPAMISVVCLPKMRLADASAAFLRGNRFPASEAARMGLINLVVERRGDRRRRAEIVERPARGRTRRHRRGEAADGDGARRCEIDEAFAWTTKLSQRLFASDEAREGMTAFLEKRPASWVPRAESGGTE